MSRALSRVQAGAIQRRFERKELSETGDVGRADWHAVDTQGGKEIAQFSQVSEGCQGA